MILKGSRVYHCKICHVGILIILISRPLKNSKCREKLSLNSHYLPKDRLSKRNTIVINLILDILPSRENWLLQGKRLEIHVMLRHTLSQAIMPLICSSKGPFIFPKNHLLSPKKPASSLPFPY